MNVLAAATLWALYFALLVFFEREDDLKGLLAVFTVELVAGHRDLRADFRGDSMYCVPSRDGGVKDARTVIWACPCWKGRSYCRRDP